MEINLETHPDKFLQDYKDELLFDSAEEVYFLWYLHELYYKQFIDKVIYHEDSFELSNGLWVHTAEQLKTKTKINKKQLFKPHKYTHDFTIKWTEKAFGVITNIFNEAIHAPLIPFWNKITRVEIKGDYDRSNMTRLFRINQKWIWDRYKIYIQLIKIPLLFKNTFTPERYLKQDYRNGQRKIHFRPEIADNFLKRLPYNK